MSDLLLKSFDAPVNENLPQLRPGDSVTVHLRIVEGTRERIQLVRGTVIRLRKSGNQANFTVRRIASNGIGVERSFLLRSPLIENCFKRHWRRTDLPLALPAYRENRSPSPCPCPPGTALFLAKPHRQIGSLARKKACLRQ